MTAMKLKGYQTYQEARANEYDQSELILMMFSGAVNYLDKAMALADSDKARMGVYLVKAKHVLLELMSSLNVEDSGEIGTMLLNTYSRQFRTLHAAHMNDDVEKVRIVRDSLIELEDAWKGVFSSDEYLAFKQQAKCRATNTAYLKG